MDLHGYPWTYMDNHGLTWISMDLHGYPWTYMDIHGLTWISMDLHGYPWTFHGLSVNMTWTFYGLSMDFFGSCKHLSCVLGNICTTL